MRFRIGDIFEIPLPDGRKGYAHYLYRDKSFLHLIQVFDFFTKDSKNVELTKLKKSEALFPPVFTVLQHAVNLERWRVIGNIPITNFVFPKFLNTFYYLDGIARTWYIYDGEKEYPIGKTLSEEYKKFEFLSVDAPDLIVKRIMTGEKPLEDLITTNITKNPNPRAYENQN